VIQQGQVFKLKARSAEGEPLWAYRYRVAGRGSSRRQVGGFASRAEAQRALQNKLARLVPGGRSATLTLGEWVSEYLETHQGERVTVAKLRWLLGKATAELGGVRLAELSPEQVCAWRLTVPEGHRFEATQALRQVLNRAVAWKLIDENPAKRGVPNPGRRCREQRPFESWAQIGSVAELLGPRFGPMIMFAVATGLRPSELFALEHGDVDRAAGVVQIRRAYANGRGQAHEDAAEQTRSSAAGDRTGGARPAAAATREPAAVPELARRPPRFPQLQPAPVEARAEGGRDRAAAQPVRPAPHLRDLRAARGGVRALAVHGHEHRDDRPPLRPPCPRQLSARGLAPRCARARTGGGRRVDTGAHARKAAPRHGFRGSRKRSSEGGGRSVDVEPTTGRDARTRNRLISRNFAKPSDGLEPSTPSLPWRCSTN
jgi:integrase